MAMRYIIISLAILCVSCTSTLPSIKPYHLDIQQGNVVTTKMLMQLKPGMTKSQVRYVMGTPLIQDSFHQDRWDYVYQVSNNGNILERHRVILDFENDALKDIKGDVVPAGSAKDGDASPMATLPEPTGPADKKGHEKAGWLEKLEFWKSGSSEQPASTPENPKVMVKEPSIPKPEVKPVTEDKPNVVKESSVSTTPDVVVAAAQVAPPVKEEMDSPSAEAVKAIEATPVNAKQTSAAEEKPTPPVTKPAVQEASGVAVATQEKKSFEPKIPKLSDSELVTARIESWAEAWRQKNISAYLKFYSDKFIPEDFTSRKAWEAQRRNRLSNKQGSIILKLDNINVSLDGNQANVTFNQHYKSANYADDVVKVLKLEMDPLKNNWMIVKESILKDGQNPQAKPPSEDLVMPATDDTDTQAKAAPDESAPVAAPSEAPTPPVSEDKPAVPKPEDTVKVDKKPEPNKEAPAVRTPGYFERMLEKIGF